MIMFLTGTPGIGKTTVASAIAEQRSDVTILCGDNIRAEIGASTTTNPVVEDALNWRLFTGAAIALRKDPASLVIIDTNGISKRLPFLRYALGEYRQHIVRLNAAFPFNLCIKKWGQAYSQGKFDHIAAKVACIEADFDIQIDGKTPQVIASEILALIQ